MISGCCFQGKIVEGEGNAGILGKVVEQTIGIGGSRSSAGGVFESLDGRIDDGDFLLELDGDRDRRGAGRNTQAALADAVVDGRRCSREATQFGVVAIEEKIVVTGADVCEGDAVVRKGDLGGWVAGSCAGFIESCPRRDKDGKFRFSEVVGVGTSESLRAASLELEGQLIAGLPFLGQRTTGGSDEQG